MIREQTGEQTRTGGKHLVLGSQDKVQLSSVLWVKFKSLSEIFPKPFLPSSQRLFWFVFMDLCQIAVYPTLCFVYLFPMRRLTFPIFGLG